MSWEQFKNVKVGDWIKVKATTSDLTAEGTVTTKVDREWPFQWIHLGDGRHACVSISNQFDLVEHRPQLPTEPGSTILDSYDNPYIRRSSRAGHNDPVWRSAENGACHSDEEIRSCGYTVLFDRGRGREDDKS